MGPHNHADGGTATNDFDETITTVHEVTLANGVTKVRCCANLDDHQPGALQIDERAPDLNLRFFRGLARSTAMRRARMREAHERQRQTVEGGEERGLHGSGSSTNSVIGRVRGAPACSLQSNESERNPVFLHMPGNENERLPIVRRFSNAFAFASFRNENFLISATIVEDEEVFIAERVSFLERKWRRFAVVFLFIFLSIMALVISLAIFLNKPEYILLPQIPTAIPSASPSLSPSLDPRPTLEIVQTRGYVNCGFDDETVEYFNIAGRGNITGRSGFRLDLVGVKYYKLQ